MKIAYHIFIIIAITNISSGFTQEEDEKLKVTNLYKQVTLQDIDKKDVILSKKDDESLIIIGWTPKTEKQRIWWFKNEAGKYSNIKGLKIISVLNPKSAPVPLFIAKKIIAIEFRKHKLPFEPIPLVDWDNKFYKLYPFNTNDLNIYFIDKKGIIRYINNNYTKEDVKEFEEILEKYIFLEKMAKDGGKDDETIRRH